MSRFKRVFLIVIDSMGIGAMPDAEKFGDAGVDTLGHISDTVEHFNIPNLRKLGLANLKPLSKVEPVDKPLAYYCALKEKSNGKDTMTGHWEMMRIHTTTPFVTFTDTGFPKELLDELSKRCGKEIIGNKSASGTEILEELAETEINEGKMIVYTSADSVLQICGNEETFDLANLYRCCEIARELCMKDEWKVGRVIARPYVGKKKGEFKRTANRHDYAVKPPIDTALNALKDAGFDALWGHRRDPIGYGDEIEKFDVKLGELLDVMREDDLLIITADHGNDPTYTGTDHTREKVPFLAYSKSLRGAGSIPERETFADMGATIAENFGVKMPEGTIGTSMLGELA